MIWVVTERQIKDFWEVMTKFFLKFMLNRFRELQRLYFISPKWLRDDSFDTL
jgi:hypothetical protein